MSTTEWQRADGSDILGAIEVRSEMLSPKCGIVILRNSGNRDGSYAAVTASEWDIFAAAVKAGEFDGITAHRPAGAVTSP